MSQAEKERTHRRIVASASRLFRERGLDGASVADVMADAGLTHGGFYKHFGSKDALVEASVADAFETLFAALDVSDPVTAAAAWRRVYLSQGHLNHPEAGCPAPALGSEISRAPKATKAAFGAGVRKIVELVAASRKGAAAARRRAALREFSMLVGAVVIARASDPALADEIIAACRDEKTPS